MRSAALRGLLRVNGFRRHTLEKQLRRLTRLARPVQHMLGLVCADHIGGVHQNDPASCSEHESHRSEERQNERAVQRAGAVASEVA